MEHGPKDIRERSLEYAVRAVKVYSYVRRRKDDAGVIFGRQFFRSASSIGANLTEARAAESRADFVHKNAVAQKEARECLYWLELLRRCNLVPARRLEPLIEETNEIVAIITAIIVKTKRSK